MQQMHATLTLPCQCQFIISSQCCNRATTTTSCYSDGGDRPHRRIVSEIPRALVTRAASTKMSVVRLSGPAHVTASGQRISTRSRIAPAFVTPAASESILKPRFRRHAPAPVNIIDVKTFFNVFFYFGHVFNVFKGASRLTRNTFKITATKFNGFINNRILYPVIRM